MANTAAKKIVYDGKPVQVESAVRDGTGKEISSTYATVTQLSDGSVTKIGTGSVGSDLRPVKIVNGVPTAVANDLVDVVTNQTIGGIKTYSSPIVAVAKKDVTIYSNTSRYHKIAEIYVVGAYRNNKYRFSVTRFYNTLTEDTQTCELLISASTDSVGVINGVTKWFIHQTHTLFTDAIRVFYSSDKIELWIDAGSNNWNYYNVAYLTDYSRILTIDFAYNNVVFFGDAEASQLPSDMTEATYRIEPVTVTPDLTVTGMQFINAEWIRNTSLDSNGYSVNGLVHNSGNETIGGTKYFTGQIRALNSIRIAPNTTSLRRGISILKSNGTTEEYFIGADSDTSSLFFRYGASNALMISNTGVTSVTSPPPTTKAVRNITISSTAPTSSDGDNGDVWILTE